MEERTAQATVPTVSHASEAYELVLTTAHKSKEETEMNKLTFAAAVASLAGLAAAPVGAQTLDDYFADKEYKNRGQCEAALAMERNNRRVNDGNTGSYTDSEYNKVVHDKYECVEVEEGVFMVMIDADWEM